MRRHARVHQDQSAGHQPADAPLLEDMLVAAVNSALEQAKAISSAEMAKATQGFSLPGLM